VLHLDVVEAGSQEAAEPEDEEFTARESVTEPAEAKAG
jgi:hypothetical protein